MITQIPYLLAYVATMFYSLFHLHGVKWRYKSAYMSVLRLVSNNYNIIY